MEGLLGLRKGTWTKEEDDLLRDFIVKHGEGKWNQVSLKAGLNRCRKSCRLRWLNYLKPTIKRGNFAEDEIDLILRLHKLLGNRWSLIAGRLPGRTSNDLKNYWSSRIRKKTASAGIEKMKGKSPETTKSIIIRPRPRTFTKSLHCLSNKATTSDHIQPEENFSWPLPSSPPIENEIDWWKTLLDDKDSFEATTSSSTLGLQENHLITNFWVEDVEQPTGTSVTCSEESLMSRTDFSVNMDLWNHSMEEEKRTENQMS